MSVTLTEAQYNSLLLAAQGDTAIDVAQLEVAINAANNIKRYLLWIRWYEVGGSVSQGIDLMDWPQDQQYKLVQDRAIAREDVDAVLQANAQNPVDPLVTYDPRGLVGWTLLVDYDFYANNKPL